MVALTVSRHDTGSVQKAKYFVYSRPSLNSVNVLLMNDAATLNAVRIPLGSEISLDAPLPRPWQDLWEMKRLEALDHYGHADFHASSPEKLRANWAIDDDEWAANIVALYLPADAALAHSSHITSTDREFDVETGETMVGLISVSFPLRDNLDMAYLSIFVPERYRGHGIEAASLAFARSIVERENRTKIGVWTPIRTPDPGEQVQRPVTGPGEIPVADQRGRLYAENGFYLAAVEKSSMLHLGVGDERTPIIARLSARRDELSPEGYAVRCWEGPTPGDLIDELVGAWNKFEADMPRAEGTDPETQTTTTFAKNETNLIQRGWYRLYAAVVDNDGSIVALSGVQHRNSSTAYHSVTWVHPDHRGKSLGEFVKTVNYLDLTDKYPGVERVMTENAESNGPMWAINERLGFTVAYLEANWYSCLVDGVWGPEWPDVPGEANSPRN